MFYLFIVILAIAIWRWLKKETREITAGTVNRTGITVLLTVNKALDGVDDALGLNENYYNELVTRYSKTSTKKLVKG